MRVVIAQMKHETNTFSPVPTPLARFANGSEVPPEGAEAYQAYKIERRKAEEQEKLALAGPTVTGGDLDSLGAREASLSPDEVQPGDPEIKIPAPQGARSVIVTFPWGESKVAVWDRDVDAWMVRFLIDKDTWWLQIDRARLSPLGSKTWMVWLVVAAALSLTGAAIIARLINQPLKQLSFAASRVRGGDFDKAAAQLSAFQRRFPSSGYGDSVRYWLGNAHYARRDYKSAIDTFRAFVTAAPEHPRAAEAMLAMANSQAEMKDTKAARKTLDDLLKAYPKSEAAAAGKERLASLK